jgi:riboflavin kinase/FMN adenylyltransferase
VTGTIVRGDQRGRALGFPTINVAPPPDKLLPHDGIYATWVVLGDTRYRAASSLGVRPTFGGGPRELEAHIIDFSDEVYGRQATVEFVARLRDEIRFDRAEDLSEQIAKDVQQTRLALR